MFNLFIVSFFYMIAKMLYCSFLFIFWLPSLCLRFGYILCIFSCHASVCLFNFSFSFLSLSNCFLQFCHHLRSYLYQVHDSSYLHTFACFCQMAELRIVRWCSFHLRLLFPSVLYMRHFPLRDFTYYFTLCRANICNDISSKIC